eukprot:692146-Rhodomonas_salina.1
MNAEKGQTGETIRCSNAWIPGYPGIPTLCILRLPPGYPGYPQIPSPDRTGIRIPGKSMVGHGLLTNYGALCTEWQFRYPPGYPGTRTRTRPGVQLYADPPACTRVPGVPPTHTGRVPSRMMPVHTSENLKHCQAVTEPVSTQRRCQSSRCTRGMCTIIIQQCVNAPTVRITGSRSELLGNANTRVLLETTLDRPVTWSGSFRVDSDLYPGTDPGTGPGYKWRNRWVASRIQFQRGASMQCDSFSAISI